jgi:hypothetical protein
MRKIGSCGWERVVPKTLSLKWRSEAGVGVGLRFYRVNASASTSSRFGFRSKVSVTMDVLSQVLYALYPFSSSSLLGSSSVIS